MLTGFPPNTVRLFFLFSLWLTGSGVGLLGCNPQNAAARDNAGQSSLSPISGDEHILLWTDASRNLTLASAADAAANAPLRYAGSADCPLVYDFEATTTTTRVSEPSRAASPAAQAVFRNRPQTRQVLGRFELRPGQTAQTEPGGEEFGTWYLHGRQLGHYTVRNEIRMPGKELQESELEDVVLQNFGNELRTAQSEPVLWNQLHPFGGLAQFFPRLPAAAQPGSPPAASGKPALRIVERLFIDEQPALVLSTTSEQFSARYVMLTSGQMLHATTSQTQKVSSEHGEFTRTQLAEARLTGSCNGPTLPPIGQKTSPSRNALDTYTRLVFAVHGNHADRAFSFLSQDLVDAHGAENIVAMLREHIDQYGINSLGDPRLVDPVDIDGRFMRFRVAGRAENIPSAPDTPVTVINHITIEDSESGMRVLSIASTSQQTSQNWNMLEISPRRIFTASIPATP